MSVRRRTRRKLHPRVESVERRELMSGITAMLATQPRVHVSALTLTGNQTGTNSPFIPGLGTPTPHEMARERFHATFSGPVVSGPGRFSSESKIYYFRGTGGSNQFLHGDYQMAIVFPTDRTQPITGGIYMQDRNNNSGGQMAFDLTIDPSSVDRFGRPTRATFVNDPNIYSGIYYFNTANGSMKIRYFGHQAAVVVDGLVYTNGLTGVFRNTDLVTK